MKKTILITGAGTGIGRDAAFALAARGHQVIATTFNEAQAEQLRAECSTRGQALQVFKLDITDPADRALQLAIARAVARAWRDPEFRARLEADPRAVLIEGGANVPEGVDVVIAPEGTQVLALPDGPPDDPDAAAEAAARQAYEAIFGRPAE